MLAKLAYYLKGSLLVLIAVSVIAMPFYLPIVIIYSEDFRDPSAILNTHELLEASHQSLARTTEAEQIQSIQTTIQEHSDHLKALYFDLFVKALLMYIPAFVLTVWFVTAKTPAKKQPIEIDHENLAGYSHTWQPLKPSGQSGKTHWLEEVKPGIYKKVSGQIYPTLTLIALPISLVTATHATLFELFMGEIGIGQTGMHLLNNLDYLYGLPLLVIGFYVFMKLMSLIGFRVDTHRKVIIQDVHETSFSDIAGIQILSEEVAQHEGGSIFTSYELNIIKKNGERICIVDHSDLFHITQDAKLLKELLQTKLWLHEKVQKDVNEWNREANLS